MVKINLRWSREHVIDFSKQVYERLLNDKVSEYFEITLNLSSCNLQINDGSIDE